MPLSDPATCEGVMVLFTDFPMQGWCVQLVQDERACKFKKCMQTLCHTIHCCRDGSGENTTAECRVCKDAGSQSFVRFVYNLQWVASARHLYRVAVEPGEVAQLCVFILGMPYLYLGVLSVCLGMGVWYMYSSLVLLSGCTFCPPHLFSSVTHFSNHLTQTQIWWTNP